jgi:hypothetical protein
VLTVEFVLLIISKKPLCDAVAKTLKSWFVTMQSVGLSRSAGPSGCLVLKRFRVIILTIVSNIANKNYRNICQNNYNQWPEDRNITVYRKV